MPSYVSLSPGEPAPWFQQRSPSNPRYNIDTAGGRYLILCFLGTAGNASGARAVQHALALPQANDAMAALYLISADPSDEEHNRLANRMPGLRVIWDFDLKVARAYGVAPQLPESGPLLPCWVITDPTLRIKEIIRFAQDGSDLARLSAVMNALPPPDRYAGRDLQAPILYLPNVFDPELCQLLIDTYDAQGGELSGFMREVAGRTVGINDSRHKVRRDVNLEDRAVIARVQDQIRRKIVPEIAKVHQFHVTRMERYLIGCYAAEDGGHFAPHRDNTTAGTAHRRFAVSINLNDTFDGGEVSFPEYGPRGFKASAGGAVVFSCSLLHAVSQVTSGRRYAFLPFLYDDAAAKVRERNLHLIGQKPDTESP
jgi:predicted 2-oxoglutarate/Fe(II)-dependent dioxygenase YbiX/peroxiredoxin